MDSQWGRSFVAAIKPVMLSTALALSVLAFNGAARADQSAAEDSADANDRELAQAPLCVASLLNECKSLPALKTAIPPSIDGTIDAAEWAGAAYVNDFHQVVPIEFAPTGETTEVWLTYDKDYLYVGARMVATRPDKLVARRLIQGGSLSGEDRFRVLLGPLNNGRTGYLFLTNANGIRREGLIEGPNDFNLDWTAIWRARGRETETGWEAEMAIPFKSINFDPKNNNWAISFSRTIAHSDETVAWTSQDRRTNTETLGVLTGIEGIEQGVGLDVIPNLNVRQRHDEATGEKSFELEPGLDVIYNVTPTLKAALTVNTDFATTDVDDQVVNLSRFSIFLPERRDFFLQDNDIFRFGNISRNGAPFFSRRIGLDDSARPIDLKLGAKLTGRVGNLSIGALGVRQEKGGFEADGETRLTGNADLFVGRATLDVLENSTLGVVATHGDPFTGEGANTIGADFLWRDSSLIPGRRIIGEFWWQRSHRPGGVEGGGGWGAFINFPSREGLRGFVNYRVIEDNFDPALGFVNRDDISEYSSQIAYDYRPSSGPFRRINAEIFAQRFDRRSLDTVESEFLNLRAITLIWNAGDRAQLDLRHTREVLFEPFEIVDGVVIPPGDYNWEAVRVLFQAAGQRKLSIDGELEVGGFFGGDRVRWNGVINYRPNKHLRVRFSYNQNDVTLPQGAFTTRIAAFRSDVAFNSQLSWITRVQYDNVSDAGSVNTRLRYEVRPGRNLFLVFNQGFQREELFDRSSRVSLTDAEMTFRIAYTFRF